MEVIWTPRALKDLQELRAYIRKENPGAGVRVARRILETVSLISEQPSIGRPGRVPKTREIAVTQTPFLIPYSVIAGRLFVLRILHGARKWPQEKEVLKLIDDGFWIFQSSG